MWRVFSYACMPTGRIGDTFPGYYVFIGKTINSSELYHADRFSWHIYDQITDIRPAIDALSFCIFAGLQRQIDNIITIEPLL